MTPESQAKADRQMRWRTNRDASKRAIAEKRLKALDAQKNAVDRAIQAYRHLDHGDVPEIRIRSGFVHLSKAAQATRPATTTTNRSSAIATRPPLTRLIAAAGSRALPAYLSVLYVAQLELDSGRRPFVNVIPNMKVTGEPVCWTELVGVHHSDDRRRSPQEGRRRRRRALNTALRALVDNKLVRLTGPDDAAGMFDQFAVLMEDGTEREYTAAGESVRPPAVVRLPSTFFLHGWHLVLSPAEVATLLVIIDRTARLRRVARSGSLGDKGVDLKEVVRWREYGLSDEAYESVHLLHQLGIVEVIDPMPDRATPLTVGRPVTGEDGTVTIVFDNAQRIPFRLVYPPTDTSPESIFNRDAFAAVRAAIEAAPSPVGALRDR